MNRYSWWTVNSVESLAERHNTKSLDLNQAQKNYMTSDLCEGNQFFPYENTGQALLINILVLFFWVIDKN